MQFVLCNMNSSKQEHKKLLSLSYLPNKAPAKAAPQTAASSLPGSSLSKATPASPAAGENPSHPLAESFPSATHSYVYNSVSCLANDSVSYLRGQQQEADVSAKRELFEARRKVLCSPSNQSCKIM